MTDILSPFRELLDRWKQIGRADGLHGHQLRKALVAAESLEISPTQWAYDQAPTPGGEGACKALEKHRERAGVAERERDTLRTLLAHPQALDLLEHHRRLDHGECSCQSTYDHGTLMDRGEWIAHVIDDARTRRMIE